MKTGLHIKIEREIKEKKKTLQRKFSEVVQQWIEH